MKKFLFLILSILVFEIQICYSKGTPKLELPLQNVSEQFQKEIENRSSTIQEQKMFKICSTIKVRSVQPCPSGSSGGGLVTYTSIAYASNSDGSCGGATTENILFANTETLNFCSSNTP
jgi:hypothetical protein